MSPISPAIVAAMTASIQAKAMTDAKAITTPLSRPYIRPEHLMVRPFAGLAEMLK